MVMLRSSSFLKRTVWTPDIAFTTVDFPWATCPIVPEMVCNVSELSEVCALDDLLKNARFRSRPAYFCGSCLCRHKDPTGASKKAHHSKSLCHKKNSKTAFLSWNAVQAVLARLRILTNINCGLTRNDFW